MSSKLAQLVEKLNRRVYDKGDVDLLVSLDRIQDFDTESEQLEALSEIVREINEKRAAGKG